MSLEVDTRVVLEAGIHPRALSQGERPAGLP